MKPYVLLTDHVGCSELYHSLVGRDADFSYDMYTARVHLWRGFNWTNGNIERRFAVGIVDGLAAIDQSEHKKQDREQHFPMELVKKGVEFAWLDGQASMEEDRVRIIGEIGEEDDELDRCVHSVVAAASLLRAIKGKDCEEFMEAVCEGKMRKLQLDLTTCDEVATKKVCELWHGFDAEKLEELTVRNVQGLTNWLPESMLKNCSVLTKLDLEFCNSLAALPEAIGNCTQLKELNLSCCKLQLSDILKEQLEANQTKIVI